MSQSESNPAQQVVSLFGGKWKASILYHIAQNNGPLRFNALRRKMPDVTQKMLTQQLRQLACDGLLLRTQYVEIPVRVEYSLTDLGMSLMPIFGELCAWNAKHHESVELARKQYNLSGAPS